LENGQTTQITKEPAMATVTLDASNQTPPNFELTLIGVVGREFRPGTRVNIAVFHSSHRVLVHGVPDVGLDGSFTSFSHVTPKLPCDTELTAIVHDADGVEFRAKGNVFCD
jgi:hypothetical protein